MISTKHGERFAAFLIAAAFISVILFSVSNINATSAETDSGIKMEYEDKLFDTGENIKINLIMDSDKWQDMLDNAISEEYYDCDAEINGSMFSDIAIRPKGNTSLSSIVSDPDSDRYSFKLEFDHYDNNKSCYGLDKLVLNNNYADATNMKEAVVYDCFEYLSAVSPLTNYAEISVNGEYIGIYLAIEAVEESFLLRNYGTGYGSLYKPDSMEIGGGGQGGFNGGNMPQIPPDMNNNTDGNTQNNFDGNVPFEMNSNSENNTQNDLSGNTPPDMNNNSDSNTQNNFFGNVPPEMSSNSENNSKENMPPDMNGGKMGGMSGNGSNLNYTDSNTESYSAIWDGEVTETDDDDHKRVVEALENISKGSDLEKYLDVDNVLKYMAAHTFAVNLDSFSGNMAHNYYLYEKNGRLDIIPWDYNLSFGGMNGGDASDVINFPIDTPFGCTDFFDALLENEEYLEQYHGYLGKLCEGYIEGGLFEKKFYEIQSRIDEAVKTDPTAFYSYDEYTAAADMLYKTVKLRSESIIGQLSGIIPSTEEGQRENSEKLTDSSEIDISVMGTMNHGNERNNENGFEGFPERGQQEGGFDGNRQFPQMNGSEISDNNKTSDNIIILCICGGVALLGILFGTLYKRR